MSRILTSGREFSGWCVNEAPYTSLENNIRSNGFCHPGYTFQQISTGQRSGIAPTYHRNHPDIIISDHTKRTMSFSHSPFFTLFYFLLLFCVRFRISFTEDIFHGFFCLASCTYNHLRIIFQCLNPTLDICGRVAEAVNRFKS